MWPTLWLTQSLMCKGPADLRVFSVSLSNFQPVLTAHLPARHRQLPDSEMQAFLFGSTEDPSADAAWDAFWGFDCVAQGGLCERAYSLLHIPETAWPGLKQLPQVQSACLP